MSTTPIAAQPPPRIVADATCTACGCLCDDLAVTVEGASITAAENACEIGSRWFLADHGHRGVPPATINGRSAPVEEALDRAAAILRGARMPVVLGLSRTTTEAVAAAVALADRIGAVVDPDSTRDAAPRLQAIQRVGRVSATLGEVKNRADAVVFFGADPVVTHPRHFERYSVEPRGRFVPGGRGDRTLIVIDSVRTATAGRADLFIALASDRRLEALETLRALLQGAPLDPGRVGASTGVPLATFLDLLARLRKARYRAWFVPADLGRGAGGSAVWEAALTLVRDLNGDGGGRCVLLSLGSAGNAPGAEAALTWQTGLAHSVSLAHGIPRSLPGVTSAEALLARGEADVALVVGEPTPGGLSDAARAHLSRIPTIVIAPRATAPLIGPPPAQDAVAIDSATYGIDAAGTVMRADGVVLPLRPPLASTIATDRTLLLAIASRLSPLPPEV